MIEKLKQNRVGRTYLGGSRIGAFTGERWDGVTDTPHPEDWLASATGVINDGVEEGIGLTEDGRRIPEIVGNATLPILLKLLDSDERLAIQVHPTADFAKQYLGSDFGKTECWYFLDCAPNACVYLGFQTGVTRQDWADAVRRQDVSALLAMLHRIPVKKGDFVFVDGGMPHAIGGGCFMIELQEPSDLMIVAEYTTVSGRRLPEYRRDMGLGEALALDMYGWRTWDEQELTHTYCRHLEPCADRAVCVVDSKMTDRFRMHLLCGNASLRLQRPFAVAVVTAGSGSISGRAAHRGDRFFLANESEVKTCGDKEFTVVICQ